MRLTIDTETDTYEQAIAAVQAAYGLRSAVPEIWPDAPDPRPGPQNLADDDLADGWTDQLLFRMIASLMPGARDVLRRVTELGGGASYEDVQRHFADHPTAPIPPSKIGGTLTSVKAVQRRTGPEGAGPLLQRDERARRYRIDDVLVAGLQRAFALADVRPDLLRGEGAEARGLVVAVGGQDLSGRAGDRRVRSAGGAP
ncbi:hypothetical protein [Streptomyces sp. AC550_RSS872]|uniref:hypothetical protein n=1 Tax=Streptomyces sp. AC550_RSS872 TaxID=2823689 RepID=UPI0020B7F4F4|nr:hypothetical protein [Streptomyces sp. AC550_RSS872]